MSITPEPAAPLGDLVAAHFQRLEVAMLSRVLTTTLAGALPPAMVRVERRRTFLEWLTRRPGIAIGVRISSGDKALTFRAPAVGVTEASVGHTVGGVVLSTTPVTIAEWLDQLAELLNRATQDDKATQDALQRALLPPSAADAEPALEPGPTGEAQPELDSGTTGSGPSIAGDAQPERDQGSSGGGPSITGH